MRPDATWSTQGPEGFGETWWNLKDLVRPNGICETWSTFQLLLCHEKHTLEVQHPHFHWIPITLTGKPALCSRAEPHVQQPQDLTPVSMTATLDTGAPHRAAALSLQSN